MHTKSKENTIVKLKLDIIFKRVFGNVNNKAIIAAFISDLLEIPRSSIREIMINNVELAPEYFNQKFSRLDLKLNVDDRIVNVEMQVNNEGFFKERTLFYWSKLYSEELSAGEEYGVLKKRSASTSLTSICSAVTIIILIFAFLKANETSC